jgi:hypothetical protein
MVESLHRMDEAHGSLLDEIRVGHAATAKRPRQRDHQPQVALDHLVPGAGIAALDPLREPHLLGGGQQRFDWACRSSEPVLPSALISATPSSRRRAARAAVPARAPHRGRCRAIAAPRRPDRLAAGLRHGGPGGCAASSAGCAAVGAGAPARGRRRRPTGRLVLLLLPELVHERADRRGRGRQLLQLLV